MQIEKINENQLEIILNLEDLYKNNISLHSFMCNSFHNRNLFFNILNIANKEVGFNIKNHEIIVEAFSIPSKNTFTLLITKIPKTSYLYLSKKNYGKLKFQKSFWLQFHTFESFCDFCKSLNNNLVVKSSLFLLNKNYFLHIQIPHFRYLFKTLINASEFSEYIYNDKYIPNENSEIIIKNSAIQTAKTYFI